MSEGELIVDNYKLLTALATGQQTQVWEVIDQSNGEKLAMKLLLPDAFKDPVQKNALKFEGKVMESLDHPNVIKYKKLFVGKNHGYLVMELFKAPNLKSQTQGDILQLHVRLKRLIEQLSQAMAHIHDKGWIHKDLKPDNILFSKAAELRVIDFSLSAKLKTGFLSNLSFGKRVIQGTRTYMAPEQIKCTKLGPYTDIYNFGVTVFEMLTGRTPYAGNSPNDLLKKHLSEQVPAPSIHNPNVTPEMDRLVMRMLAKKPENRQKTFNEVLAEIRNISLFKESPEKMMEQRETDKANEGQRELALNERRDSRSDAAQSSAKAAASLEAEEKGEPAPAPAPIRIPAAALAVAGANPGAPTGAVPGGAAPAGVVAGRPPQGAPGTPAGMPPRPGLPPGARPGNLPPGNLPPGARPGNMPPPGMAPRPGMPTGAFPPGSVPPGGPRPMGPGGLPPQGPGGLPPKGPGGQVPQRMPVAGPGGGPPPGARPNSNLPPGAPQPGTPFTGGPPTGMPTRPGMPAVAAGGPPPGGPRPGGMPPTGAPPGSRPGMPAGAFPPGQGSRPSGMAGPPQPGARPIGTNLPPGGGPRPMGPGGAGPKPTPAPEASEPGEISLDDFKIT